MRVYLQKIVNCSVQSLEPVEIVEVFLTQIKTTMYYLMLSILILGNSSLILKIYGFNVIHSTLNVFVDNEVFGSGKGKQMGDYFHSKTN